MTDDPNAIDAVLLEDALRASSSEFGKAMADAINKLFAAKAPAALRPHGGMGIEERMANLKKECGCSSLWAHGKDLMESVRTHLEEAVSEAVAESEQVSRSHFEGLAKATEQRHATELEQAVADAVGARQQHCEAVYAKSLEKVLEGFESERERHAAELAQVTEQRDVMIGKAAHIRDECDRMKKELAQERANWQAQQMAERNHLSLRKREAVAAAYEACIAVIRTEDSCSHVVEVLLVERIQKLASERAAKTPVPDLSEWEAYDPGPALAEVQKLMAERAAKPQEPGFELNLEDSAKLPPEVAKPQEPAKAKRMEPDEVKLPTCSNCGQSTVIRGQCVQCGMDDAGPVCEACNDTGKCSHCTEATVSKPQEKWPLHAYACGCEGTDSRCPMHGAGDPIGLPASQAAVDRLKHGSFSEYA